MSKIMIWVGQFDSEADFEKYMDQSAFRQWWKDYDEDNKELRCQFCKELGVMSYDEDFLIMVCCFRRQRPFALRRRRSRDADSTACSIAGLGRGQRRTEWLLGRTVSCTAQRVGFFPNRDGKKSAATRWPQRSHDTGRPDQLIRSPR